MNPRAKTRFRIISRKYPLILASSSPRRRRILEQIALPYRSCPSHIEENHAAGDPAAVTRTLAERKARAALLKIKNHWVLGADTLVVLGEKILGKPEDPDEARDMLLQLSDKDHRVVTGFTLLDPSGDMAHAEEITTMVKMKRVTQKEIEAYIGTGEPLGKAGSYAIQGVGAFMVETISGSYTNVVGLPICALIKALLSTGALKNYPIIK